MLKKFYKYIFLFLGLNIVHGNTEYADFLKLNVGNSFKNRKELILKLNQVGIKYSLIPWIKYELINSKSFLKPEYENVLSQIVNSTGVKSFEALPAQILRKSSNTTLKFILGKKYLKKKQYKQALKVIQNKVDITSSFYPYILHLRGALNGLLKQYDRAINEYRNCVYFSEKFLKNEKDNIEQQQLSINRDYCILGEARIYFTQQEYNKSELRYLDIDKKSFVWPQILFEEAWNSYYMKNYNRTLGKLVTYRAPVFDYYFNPEVELLKSLTYMRMCLYDDAKKISDRFYAKYLDETRYLRNFLLKNGKKYSFYFNLMQDFQKNQASPPPLIRTLLKSIAKDGSFLEMKKSFWGLLKEQQVFENHNDIISNKLRGNIQQMKMYYMRLIGGYIRKQMVHYYAHLYRTFEGMSYINLEVLRMKKEKIYQNYNYGSKRGNIKYLDRNKKQYFWSFNGEFWADELGDYVFALANEC